jgi:hypothetical protein
MGDSDASCFEPRIVIPGEPQRIRLVGHSASRVVLTRGRERSFEFEVRSDSDGLFVEFMPPADATKGLYNAVLHSRPLGRRVVRNAISILDPKWLTPRFPRLPQYDKWFYVLDEAGIPRKDMGGRIGYVRHPLVATYYAMTYFGHAAGGNCDRDISLEAFWTITRWLESVASDGPEGSFVVRHPFPLSTSFRLESGWISGLTQGRVAETFVRAGRLDGDPRWNELARRCCEIMRVPVERGGLLACDNLGCVSIEEYPTKPGSWALNGIGSAVHSLETIASQIDLPWAADLIDRVCESMGRKIRLFDAPDTPGSRVQLALRYDLVLRTRSSWGLGSPLLELHGVRVGHHAEAATSVDGDVATGGARSARGSLRFEATLDANRDPFDATTDASSSLELDITSDQRSVATLSVETEGGCVRIGRARLVPGRQRISFRFDAQRVFPGGIGRIARSDETYHTTNLAWMWSLSRFGTDPRLTHTARRWLLSLCTGIGRVPLDLSGVDLSSLRVLRAEAENARRSANHAHARAARMKMDIIDELLHWSEGGGEASVAYLCPSVIPAGACSEVHVYGFGFRGDERVEIDGARVHAEVVSADEIVVSTPVLSASDHELRVLSAANGSTGRLPLTARACASGPDTLGGPARGENTARGRTRKATV